MQHMWCDLDLDLAWQPSTGHVSSGSLFVNTLLKLQISFLVGGNFSWDFMISFLAGGIILITKSGDATVSKTEQRDIFSELLYTAIAKKGSDSFFWVATRGALSMM